MKKWSDKEEENVEGTWLWVTLHPYSVATTSTTTAACLMIRELELKPITSNEQLSSKTKRTDKFERY